MCAMPAIAPNPAPIAIERLVKIYKTVPAVDGISFTLKAGSVTGLLGGNGAGKTTTIASIMGSPRRRRAASPCSEPRCRGSAIACCIG